MNKFGMADFGQYAKRATVSAQNNDNELAVRLGAITQFSNTGNVIYQNSFENGLSADKCYDGGNSSISNSIKKSYFSPYSVHFYSNKTGEGQPNIVLDLPYFLTGKIGFKCIFMLDDWSSDIILQFQTVVNDRDFIYKIKYETGHRRMSVLNDLNLYSVVADNIKIWCNKNQWVFFKIIIDLDDGWYHKIFINDVLIENINIHPFIDTIITYNYCRYIIEMQPSNLIPINNYLSSIVITNNE